MHPRSAGPAALGALALLVAVVLVAPVVTGPDRADAATTRSTGTIDAHGTGRVQGTPDVLEVVIGVSTTADSAQAALEQANKESGQVINSLKAAGVAPADIQTRDFSIYPSYDITRKRSTYSVANSVAAKLRDLLKAGAILDAAASGASNDIRIQGVSFSFTDDSALLAAARLDAVHQARAQAGQLARGAGVKLGKLRSITEASHNLPTATAANRQSDVAGSAVPIEPGSESLSISVHVVYSIAS